MSFPHMKMLEDVSPRSIRRSVCSNKHNITRRCITLSCNAMDEMRRTPYIPHNSQNLRTWSYNSYENETMLFNPRILVPCIHSSVLLAVVAFLAIKMYTERLLSSCIFSNTALHYPLTTALFGSNVACAFLHVWLLTNDGSRFISI